MASTTAPVKKVSWGMVIIITIAVSAICLTCGYVKRNPGNRQAARQAIVSYPTPDQPREITLTTEWSPVIYNRRDMTLEYFFRTPNLWWQMRINGKQVYDLTPINYPESTFMNMTQVVYFVEWRIAPPRITAEDDGKRLVGKLEYYFRPSDRLTSN